MTRKNHPITSEELERAFYLDFEGEGASKRGGDAPDPVLGGVVVDDEYTWTVLSPTFAQVADHYSAPTKELADYLSDLIERAQSERRRIVYWTSHEEELFERYGFPPSKLGFDLKIPVKPHCRELFKQSKDAYNSLFGASKSARVKLRQKAFGLCVQCAEQECGLSIPSTYGKGLVGERIRYCAEQANKKSSYASWSRGTKAKWTKLLNHNRHDCKAMIALAAVFLSRSPESGA